MTSARRDLLPAVRPGSFTGDALDALDALRAGDHTGVLALADARAAVVAALGDPAAARALRLAATRSLVALGRTAEALELTAALVEGACAEREPLATAQVLATSAEVALRAGRRARAVDHLARAHHLVDAAVPTAAGPAAARVAARVAVGLASQAAGDAAGAARALRGALVELRAALPAGSPEGLVGPAAVGGADVLEALAALTLAHVAEAAGAELAGDPAPARAGWWTAASAAARWRRAAGDARSGAHTARALTCEALAWARAGRPEVADALVLHADRLVDPACGRVEGLLAEVLLAETALRAGAVPAARWHLQRARATPWAREPGTWSALVLAAGAGAELAEQGHQPAAAHWRAVVADLVGAERAAAAGFAAEVDARARELRAAAALVRPAPAAASAAVPAPRPAPAPRALVDALTGVATRTALDDALADSATRGLRTGACFVGITDLEEIAADHSRVVADAVLRQLADLLVTSCRASDLVARHGDDEFVVLTDADSTALLPFAERVRDAVAAHPWERLSPGLDVSVSVGIAASLPAAAVLAAADAVLRGVAPAPVV